MIGRGGDRPGLVRLVALLALVLVGACQLEVGVAFDVEGDGSGQVRVGVALDVAAARQVPELARQLEVDDLVRGGWTVTGPTLEGDGRTWVRAVKPFATPDEAGWILEELTGPAGPYRGLRLERSRSFFAETWRFDGQVDLTTGLASFSDDALRERLDGTSFGATDAELELRAGQPLDQAVRFRLEVRLPGALEADADADVEGGAVWFPVLGQDTPVAARGRVLDGRRVGALSVAVVAGVALVTLVGWRRVQRHR